MPNEIYHRSEWGNPKAEGFGDVYFDASATNKLYKHSDYYENSDGTDKILRDIPNKASIVLTPTAYSDGSLNTVIPPYQVLPQELVTNGTFDTDSDWVKSPSGVTISGGSANFTSGQDTYVYQDIMIIGKKYFIELEYNIASLTTGYFGSNGGSGNAIISMAGLSGSGSLSGYITASSVRFLVRSSSFNGSIDNVSVKEVQEADFDFSRGSSATRVNEKGLIEDVQILSGNLVQNGDFEEIGSELTSPVNFLGDWFTTGATSITENTFQASGSGIGVYFSLTINKIYKVKVSNVSGDISIRYRTSNGGSGTVAGNFDEFIYVNTYNSTTPNIYLRASSETTATVGNVSVKEVGQNWSFDTGWSIANGQANCDGVGINSLQQSGITTTGKIYKLTFDIISKSNDDFLIISTNFGDTYVSGSSTSLGTNTFYIQPTNGTGIRFRVANGTTLSIDNISVIEITDDTDIPRIDYTSGQGALLLEPQSTNKVTQSETFSTWSKYNLSLTSANLPAPDGSTSVIKLTPSNTNNAEYNIYFNVGNNSATSSIFAKMGEVRYILFKRNSTNVSWRSVVFDLQEGVVAANNYSSDAYPKITHYGNGWYRCEIYFENVGHANLVWGLSDGIDQNYTPTNTTDGLYIWGAQQEDLSFATSYIPTESSTVTRAADVANNSGNADLFNDSEGVLYAEISSVNDGGTKLISIANTSGSENTVWIGYKLNGFYFVIRSEGSTTFQTSVLPVQSNSVNKSALSYSNSNIGCFINGFKVFSDTNVVMPIGLDQLSFSRKDGSLPFYGKTKELAVFKEALTDAELESLTSWISFVEMATDLEYTLE